MLEKVGDTVEEPGIAWRLCHNNIQHFLMGSKPSLRQLEGQSARHCRCGGCFDDSEWVSVMFFFSFFDIFAVVFPFGLGLFGGPTTCRFLQVPIGSTSSRLDRATEDNEAKNKRFWMPQTWILGSHGWCGQKPASQWLKTCKTMLCFFF